MLLIDAAQGVEAQTIGNLRLAQDNGLVIIPVINKIDLLTGEPERVRDEVVEILGVDPSRVLFCSAKTGEGVEEVLRAIVNRIPAPRQTGGEELKALVFDSTYDPYRGVVTLVRVVSGTITRGMEIEMMAAGSRAQVESLGYLKPDMEPAASLGPGEVGFVATGIKDVSMLPVGDTLTAYPEKATDRRSPVTGNPSRWYSPACTPSTTMSINSSARHCRNFA